jgi:hypothetical protein
MSNMSLNINIQININNLDIRPLNRQVTTDKIFSHLAKQYCERISENNVHTSLPSPLTRQTNYEITYFQERIQVTPQE